MDDGRGGLPLIMGYVDDVNILVLHKDLELFCNLFVKYGEPYGAIINSEKTQIMTTTSGRSVADRLLTEENNESMMIQITKKNIPYTEPITLT